MKNEVEELFADSDAAQQETPTSLIVLGIQKWRDPRTGEEVAVTIPVGTRIIRVDPTVESRYLELVEEVEDAIADINALEVNKDEDKGQMVQKIAFVQKLSRAIDQHRETYKDPINKYGNYIQTVFKQKLLDPLKTAKDMANAKINAFDVILRAEADKEAKKARERAEAIKEAAAPEVEPGTTESETGAGSIPPPPTITSPGVHNVVTESGTHFSKKKVTFECKDMSKVPDEYTEKVLATKTIQTKAEEAMADIKVDGDHEDIIPGIVIHITFPGQVRA